MQVPERTDGGIRVSGFLTPRYTPLEEILTGSVCFLGDWEGPEGLEEVDEATLAAQAEELKSTRTYDPEPKPIVQAPPPPESESEDDDPSSDEYQADGKDDAKKTAAKVRPILG